jgi:tetratricopeptide (TPR) repeat protein
MNIVNNLNMKILIRKSVIIFFITLNLSYLFAQKPIKFESPEFEFNTAMELFQKEKYGSAQQYFKYVYENTPNKQQDIKSNSYFYIGVCAAQLYNEDAIFYLTDFIRLYPVHSFVPEANYYLGKFYFYKKQYKNVIETFNKIDERNVRPEEIAEFHFKKGYSYFATNKYDEAKSLMLRAKKADGPYKLRATYYLAHIAYEEKQYEAALDGFLELKDSYEYQNIIPYYVVQILFLQKKYNELVEIAPSLYAKSNEKSKIDIARSLGLAYYNLGKYKEGEPYFTFYLEKNKAMLDSNDCFAAGYTYYNIKDYRKAIEYLSQTSKSVSIIGQTSMYVIGDCYINLGQLSLASQTFYEAYKMKIDPDITEDALYNYAKLQYETSNQPFNSAIRALEEYINQYPNSTRSEEASSYLSKIYMSTKNYQGAITSLEKITNKNPSLLRAYQRCTYFRTLELINNKEYTKAETMLDKTLQYPMDKQINISALYWKGEIEYRNGKYAESINSFRTYQRHELAKSNEFYDLSNYSLGYAYLKTNKYSDAISAFTAFIGGNSKDDINMVCDATIRMADCYYMEKNISKAITYYQKGEQMNTGKKDYVIFQQAKCYGFNRNHSGKIEMLNKLIQGYPKSTYIDDAEFELASTYHAQSQYSQAITAYQSFIKNNPKSVYVKQAYNKMALAYLNIQDETNAIKYFKHVFETYPGSQESIDALSNLENIYAENGSPGDFFDYIKNKNMNYTESKQDSITFKSANDKFIRGDRQAAIKGYADYIRQFPNGLFTATALFNKGECEFGIKDYDNALISYETLLNKYNTNNNEIAVHNAAYIWFSKNEYQKALNYFNKLLEIASNQENIIYSNNGIMRCSYELGQHRNSLNAAETILGFNQIDDDLKTDAIIYAGRSAYELGENIAAKKYFALLAAMGDNDICSEAAYKNAEIEFKENNVTESEKLIKKIIGGNYKSSYWLAKTFILYGDLYKSKGNYFQAKHTYQSIVDNFEGELKEIALQKVNEVTALEQSQNNNQKPE